MRERFDENGDRVREIMRGMTDVIKTYPPTDEMQYGPMRIGTAYPLCLSEHLKPKEEENLLFGLRICFTMLHPWDLGRFAPFSMRIRSDIKLHKKNVKRLEKIIAKLEEISNPNVELLRLINTIKYMKCMFETCKNAYEFYIEKHKLMLAQSKGEINKITAKIRKIAEAEIKNAEESIEYAENDSSIGYEPSMGYVASPAKIAWKVRQVKRMLKAELSVYEQNLK
jgi:DNA repair exonuclease SbcCD nuclease subunit